MTYLGDYNEDDTVYFIWSTNDSNGASITRATDGTVSVYKDNGATQTTTGVTDTEDFDSLTGIHACTIDLSSAAFYATGADYAVVLSAATIDGQTVNAVLAHFSIENRSNVLTSDLSSYNLMQSTTIATLASQTSFTLTAGSADDNAYNGAMIIVTDSSTSTQKAVGLISDYTGSTNTIALASDPGIFTMAVGDNVDIIAAPKQLPDAEHGANGGLVTGDANNRVAGIQGTANTLDDLNDISVSDILTTQMTEAYAADGVAPTLAQALSLIQQSIGDFSISGTTLTVKKLDGSTTAATYTLDDASDPTSRTRAT